jgi:hypothetical protein
MQDCHLFSAFLLIVMSFSLKPLIVVQMCRREEPVEVDWLVEQRCEIQRTSVRLLKLMKENDLANHECSDAALLMVGAAFSLWRAIFLAHINRTRERNVGKAKEFLEKFVRQNAITFPDDLKFQLWSFGYYLNNCRYRLKPIWSNLGMDKRDISWVDDPLPPDADAKVEWTKHHDALRRALESLEARLQNQ